MDCVSRIDVLCFIFWPQADARSFAKEAFEAPENKEEKDVSAYIKVYLYQLRSYADSASRESSESAGSTVE